MPRECIHCHESKSSKEFYGRETGCKDCKRALRQDCKSQLDKEIAELETKVDEMSLNQSQYNKHLRRMSSELLNVQDQLTGFTTMSLQQKEVIDDVADRLEHLTTVVTRLTQSVKKYQEYDRDSIEE